MVTSEKDLAQDLLRTPGQPLFYASEVGIWMSHFWVAFGKWRTLSRWTRGYSHGWGGLCPVPLVSPAVPLGLAHKYPSPVPCLAPVRGHTQRDPQARQMLPCVRRSLLRSESALQAAQEVFADLAALKCLVQGRRMLAGWVGTA